MNMKEHIKKHIQRNARNTRKTIKLKKGIIDYHFYIGTNNHSLEYKNSSEFIINYIKRTFDRGNDLVEIIRTLKIQDTDKLMPTLKMSIVQDPEMVKRENRQFELEYKAKLDEAIKRVDKYQ